MPGDKGDSVSGMQAPLRKISYPGLDLTVGLRQVLSCGMVSTTVPCETVLCCSLLFFLPYIHVLHDTERVVLHRIMCAEGLDTLHNNR